jgi:predicted amidohydrolase YtcJ
MRLRHQLVVIVAAVQVACGSTTPPPADLIVHNARIYTVDRANTVTEAIAITGDRIAAVGHDADILTRRGGQTRLIDARQAAVVPGLHDAHGHFVGLGESLQIVDLRGTASYDEVIDRVRRRVEAAAPGEWVLGRGWDQNDWPVALSPGTPERRSSQWPTHEALSAISPDNPVYLTRVDGHAGLANRQALIAAGVTSFTPDPDGGRILRTAAGEPAGVLVDRAEELVTARIPAATADQIASQALLADGTARRLGLTMVHDAGTGASTVAVYGRLIAEGRLKTRLYVMLSGSLRDLQPAFDAGPVDADAGNRMAVRAIKISADGALGSRGAALLEPYADEPGTSGLLTVAPEDVYALTLAASRAGFQTAIHAIGDRTNRQVLDVFERVQREVPGARDLRMRVEHAQILDSAEIPRLARLGIIASMQPTHATSDMPWVPARIGDARMREGAYVWRKLRTAGTRIAAGSDFPVEDPNPMLGFYAAITRQDRTGHPPGGWMPGERLTREEALRAFTIDAAYAAHAEARLGSLEPGKLADLVILSDDIMQIPPSEILKTTVQTTVIGGEVVYD